MRLIDADALADALFEKRKNYPQWVAETIGGMPTIDVDVLLKEQEAMNVDAFVQWCIDSHIMGDATVRGIKYWVGKYKEIKER